MTPRPPTLPLVRRIIEYGQLLCAAADGQGARLFNIYAFGTDDHAPLIKDFRAADPTLIDPERACFDALDAHAEKGLPGAMFARPGDRWMLWDSRLPSGEHNASHA